MEDHMWKLLLRQLTGFSVKNRPGKAATVKGGKRRGRRGQAKKRRG